MKIYGIQTFTENSVNGKKYHQEIGTMRINEDGRVFINLFMYPETKFVVKEKIFEHK